MAISPVKRGSTAVVTNKLGFPPLPELPDDVVKRFPSLQTWQSDMNKWYEQVKLNLDKTQLASQ